MADPTLKRVRVLVVYETDDGYRSEESFVGSTKITQQPYNALLGGLRELARLTSLFGFEQEAERQFNEARQAVRDWRAAQR